MEHTSVPDPTLSTDDSNAKTINPLRFFEDRKAAVGVTKDFRPQVEKVDPDASEAQAVTLAEPVSLDGEPEDPARPDDDLDEDEKNSPSLYDDLGITSEAEQESTSADASPDVG